MVRCHGFNIDRPQLERSTAPVNGWPIAFYTYRGGEPWTPKKPR